MTESTCFAVMDFGTTVPPGSTDLTVCRHLLDAHLVIADMSTCDPSVRRELGVRHALRPCTTILDGRRRLLVPSPPPMIGTR